MDFFRRIDKDQDGKITRQEFIDGILASSESNHKSKQGHPWIPQFVVAIIWLNLRKLKEKL